MWLNTIILLDLWYSILGKNSGRAQDFYASASARERGFGMGSGLGAI